MSDSDRSSPEELPASVSFIDRFGGYFRYPILLWMLVYSLFFSFGSIIVPVAPRPVHASGRVSWVPDGWINP
jgi:hypothetical protein